MFVRRFGDAAGFLNRAEEWLLNDEAANGLILAVAYSLRDGADAYRPPLYLATIEHDGDVVGCAFRTPPHKLGCTGMPLQAADVLIEDVAGMYETLPAVLGPEPAVERMAKNWSRKRGVENQPGRRQRIYRLQHLRKPARRVQGSLRRAESWDVDVVADWMERFLQEVGTPTEHPRAMTELLVDTASLVLWDDDGPKSMAGTQGRTPNGERIGCVFTPREHRGRGYASACVHGLSREILDAGRSFCMLYTDLSNPISNSIYPKLGYEAVCDVRDYTFSL